MERIKVEDVSYSYISKYQKIDALRQVSCSFEEGKLYAVIGESGSGKSTLLSLLAGLDLPSEGTIYIDRQDLASMDRDAYRRDKASVVYQSFHLFPLLTALENVELALQICRDPLDAREVMEHVGLGERLDNFPAQLSGGEQQRVSIARALAKNPKLLLCDEPTGALDYNTGKAILKLLQDTCRQRGMTVILITHNSAIAPMADRIIRIKNGRAESIETNPHPVPVETIEW